MPVSVTMPRLGESVSEGTVTRWLKQEGDRVELDEPLLEVSTDKVDTEVPSPVAGILITIVIPEDVTVDVGTEIALIGDDGTPQTEAAEPRRDAIPASTATPAPETPAPVLEARSPAAYRTPLVRKLAAEHGVDLSTVQGTGVGGRIRKQDVLNAAAAATAPPTAPTPPAPPPLAAQPQAATGLSPAESTSASATAVRGRTEQMSQLRKVIAQRMRESLQVSAQLTTVLEADVTSIAKLRGRAKNDFEAREGIKLSFLPFFTLAAVEALKSHPMMNANIDEAAGTVTYHDDVNLGIAVDTERGLLVPVIAGASDLSLAGLARRIADAADRTRANQVSADELGGGTFTITNTGSRGALFDTPIINQPQVAILGTGSVAKRPVVVDDPALGEVVAVRSMAYLSLTYDHRMVDGADAARFLTSIKDRLEQGDFAAELRL